MLQPSTPLRAQSSTPRHERRDRHAEWHEHVRECKLCRLLLEVMDELEVKNRQFVRRRPG